VQNAIELADNLDKYKDFKKQFPQTADDIIATLRQLSEENVSLRKQLKSACNALMEKKL
jgi:uncharacterized protein with ATP-grasp and redox domains